MHSNQTICGKLTLSRRIKVEYNYDSQIFYQIASAIFTNYCLIISNLQMFLYFSEHQM